MLHDGARSQLAFGGGMLPRVTRRESITWWGTGGVLLLFAVTGLIGVLLKSPEPQGSWQISISSAKVAADSPPLQHTGAASRWLLVQAKVEVAGKASQAGIGSVLRLSGVDGLVAPEPTVILLRDGSRVDRLHPGLPEDVLFAWEQATASTAPQQVTVSIAGSSPVTMVVAAS
jgi:hypothetical protein